MYADLHRWNNTEFLILFIKTSRPRALVRLVVCLFICLCVCLLVCLSVCLSLCPSVFLSIAPADSGLGFNTNFGPSYFVHLGRRRNRSKRGGQRTYSFFINDVMKMFHSVCIFLNMYLYLSTCVYAFMSVLLSLCMSAWLSVWQWICVCLSI